MKPLLILTLCLGLVACSTSQEKLLPVGDTTMLDLWQQHTGDRPLTAERQALAQRSLATHENMANEQHSYTRTAENEIQQLFPRLPNPDLVMYVFPHLAGNEPAPVPGYSTVFPFYSRVQYAMPGERQAPL